MPFGSRVNTSPRQWRVLVVGPRSHAPQLVSTLRTIDPNVSIDRAETVETAVRCLLSSVHYDAAFVLDTLELGAHESPETLVERLSIGRTPPPLVAITNTRTFGPSLDLAARVPVTMDAAHLDLRQLIQAIRSARDRQRVARLDQLIETLATPTVGNERGFIENLQLAVDELIVALDVVGARLILTNSVRDEVFEVVAGAGIDEAAPQHSLRSIVTSSPIMTVRRTTTVFGATLEVGPLSPASRARVRDGLGILLDLILEQLKAAANQRSTNRAEVVLELFEAPTPAAITRVPSRAALASFHPRREQLATALPMLRPMTIDALSRGDLTILHQPIMTAEETIVESDVLLGVGLPVGSIEPRATSVDLSPLDSLDSPEAARIANELTVPLGHWLVTTAIPTLRRLLDSGELAPGHRIHLGLLHRQLADRDTVDLIIDLLREHDIDPRSLAIDVAEPTLLEHDDTIAAMARLAELGIGLYLDGFGGAGSNFTLLRTPLLSGVKLSRDVVRGVAADERQASIVSGLIALCDVLGLAVIATGVDHRADFDWLDEYGHVNVQGELIGPALTESELLTGHIAQAS